MKLKIFINAAVVLYLSSVVCAFPKAQKINDSVVDPGALTIVGQFGNHINGHAFQQDAVVSHNGYQYVGYYNSNRHVCLSRRKLPNGPWERIEFTDYDFKSNDGHNTISVGICPNDGTIHLAFDHHGHPLHYRVSKTGAATNPADITWDASLFGRVRDYLEEGKKVDKLTYPAFFKTPADNMQMVYRVGGSGRGDWVLVDYNSSTHSWSNTRMFISQQGHFKDEYNESISRCAYPNSYTYGPGGNLHVTWVWRERTQGANHDIMYSISPDRGTTWFNNNANVLKMKKPLDPTKDYPNVIGVATGDPATEKLIMIESPDVTVVNVPRIYGMVNTQAQAVDPQGRIHIAAWHCSVDSFNYAARSGHEPHSRWGHPLAHRYNHYWRDSQGKWHRHEMKWVAGNRPKLFIRSNGDAFMIYNSPRKPLETYGNELQFRGGDLVIAAATSRSKWTDWEIIHTEEGLFSNEMLADPIRFEKERILSIMIQEYTSIERKPTKLRILDFEFRQ